jgi:hypothetical protein
MTASDSSEAAIGDAGRGKMPMQTVRKQPTDQAARDVNGKVSAEKPSPGGTGSCKHPVTRIAWLTLCLFLVAMSQPTPAADRGPLDLPLIRGCAWPFISDVQTLNAFYPDTNATYWVAPYIVSFIGMNNTSPAIRTASHGAQNFVRLIRRMSMDTTIRTTASA